MKTRPSSLLTLTFAGAALLIGGCGTGDDGDGDTAETIEAIADLLTPGFGAQVPDGDDPLTPGEVVPEPPPITPPPSTPPENVDPSALWRLEHEGSHRGRFIIDGDDERVVTLSRELRAQGFLTAVSPVTGDELWRVADAAFTFCTPVVLADGRVVAHLDGSSVTGGEDRSDDLALIDGTSGAVLDTWEPGNGAFAPCSSGALLTTDDGTLVHTGRGLQRGFALVDDEIEPLWERNWGRDADDDPIAGGRSPSFFDHAVVLGTALYMPAAELHSDGFERGVSLYRIDAKSGRGAARLELPLRSATGLQIAGPGKLLVTGADKDRGENTAVLVGGASGETGALVIDWTRTFDGDGDGVTSTVSASAIALSDGAFASWSSTDAGSTVTEFDLGTGQANWSARTSSFSNNDSIAALPAGGYAVFPFGGNFVEAYDENGDPAWEIETVDGYGFASAMGVYAGNLVMVGATDDGWGFVGIGPLPQPEPQP